MTTDSTTAEPLQIRGASHASSQSESIAGLHGGDPTEEPQVNLLQLYARKTWGGGGAEKARR